MSYYPDGNYPLPDEEELKLAPAIAAWERLDAYDRRDAMRRFDSEAYYKLLEESVIDWLNSPFSEDELVDAIELSFPEIKECLAQWWKEQLDA